MKSTKLPSYEDALKITEKSEAFFVKYGEVQGYEYAMFSYRLATYEDFMENDAKELRGLTFIKNGNIWERHLALDKFWNLNENLGTQYNDFKDKEISTIQFKEDGSLISFVVLPNKEVVPKTKMSFDNDQTDLVQTWLSYKGEEFRDNFINEIKKLHEEGYNPIFELVSPRNRIVLKYSKTELRLLKIRNTDGKYLNKYDIKFIANSLNIEYAEFIENVTLNELINDRETLQDLEGWVIRFTDDSMVKLKTEWYVAEHRLRESLERENDIVKLILEDTIDDLLAELEGDEKSELERRVALVSHYYDHRVFKALDLRVKYFQDYKEDRKAFAIANSKVQDFGVVMKNLTGIKIPNVIKERVMQENSKLEVARMFIERLEKENK